MRIKVFYILSDIDKALAFEWICDGLSKERLDLRFVILGNTDSEFIHFLKKRNVPYYALSFKGKNDLFSAWRKVYSILKKERPQVVHTHLYFANLIGITSAWLLRIPKRIYTRHYASLHHQYFPSAVYLDKLINRLATDIVVLCENLKKIVVEWEGALIKKIQLIPHGFDLQYFQKTNAESVQLLKNRYALTDHVFPIIGVIARYTEWKGVQYIIPAFKALLTKYPTAHLILANARGDQALMIKSLLSVIPKKNYTEILFESDLASLYRLFDVFVHAPVDPYCEAFGQTYVEALAVGIPSVFTLSGIANDFIEHEKNALVVKYKDSLSIGEAIERILTDGSLRDHLIGEGKNAVKLKFSLPVMLKKLEDLYYPFT